MKSKLIKVLGKITMLVAVATVSTATWLVFEQPEAPKSL